MVVKPSQRRVALSFLDQAVSSGSNFASGVAVARLSGAAQFGEYMLAFTIWIIVVGFHRALITEPLIVVAGDSDLESDSISDGISAELLVGVVVSTLVAVVALTVVSLDLPFGLPMLALSPWFMSLLVQDYWRGMAFQRRRPGFALASDLTFAGVQAMVILAFVTLGWRTVGYIITAWGVGATAGAVLGLWWFPSIGRPRLHAGWSLLLRLWPLSRWMLADFSTRFASDQASLAFVALLLSPPNYGGFRAAFSFIGPVIVILHAGANVGLPEATRRVRSQGVVALRRFARRLTTTIVVCVGLYSLVVVLGADRLLRMTYGDQFARFVPLVSLAALQYTVAVLMFGFEIALRATGRLRLLWRARVAVGIASLLTMAVLASSFGTIGAGWAGLATGAYLAIAVYAVYRLELTRSGAIDEEGRVVLPTAWSASFFPQSGSGEGVHEEPPPQPKQ